jgi:hypothetical protein
MPCTMRADAAIRELVRTERLLVSVVTYAEVLTGAQLGHHDEEHCGCPMR